VRNYLELRRPCACSVVFHGQCRNSHLQYEKLRSAHVSARDRQPGRLIDNWIDNVSRSVNRCPLQLDPAHLRP